MVHFALNGQTYEKLDQTPMGLPGYLFSPGPNLSENLFFHVCLWSAFFFKWRHDEKFKHGKSAS